MRKIEQVLVWHKGRARNWEDEVVQTMMELGSARGGASAWHYYDVKTGVPLVVHGDDLISTGPESGFKALSEGRKATYEVKEQRPGEKHSREIKALSRKMQWCDEGIVVKVEETHSRFIISELGVETERPLTTTLPEQEKGQSFEDEAGTCGVDTPNDEHP